MPYTQEFAKFPQDEQEDFLSALHDAGLNPDDFQVSTLEDTRSGGGPIIRQVSVARITNGKTMHFDGGHASQWLIDFGVALGKGYFS